MSNREADDDYKRVLLTLGDRWRVIEGRCGIQWILQRRRSTTAPGAAAWDAQGYFCTRSALIRVYRAKSARFDPVLFSLPDRFEPMREHAARV